MMNTVYEIRDEIDRNTTRRKDDKGGYIYSIDTEGALRKIAEKHRYKIVDAYGSFIGEIGDKVFFVPNAYGEEDGWDPRTPYYNFIIVTKNKTTIYENLDELGAQRIRVVEHPEIDISSLGGKRAYYLKKDYILLRAKQEYYDKFVSEDIKSHDTEYWISGPHIKINLNPNETKENKKESSRDSEPNICPDCGSSNISAMDTEADSGYITRDVKCEDCGVMWIEYFEFKFWEYK